MDLNQTNNTPFSIDNKNGRTQLIKPNQVNNVGMNSSQLSTPNKQSTQQILSRANNIYKNSNPQINKSSNANQTGPAFNPLRPQNAAQQLTGVLKQDNTQQTEVPNSPSSVRDMPVSSLDQARSAVRSMNSSDLMTLLTEISDGTLSSKGDTYNNDENYIK